jgi:hypothetical protein
MKLKLIARVISLAVFLLALADCGLLDLHPRSNILTGIEQLKERFNQAKGRPRLILLMSPT